MVAVAIPSQLTATQEDALLAAIVAFPAQGGGDPTEDSPSLFPTSRLDASTPSPSASSRLNTSSPHASCPLDPLALSTRFQISLPTLLDYLAHPTTRARIAAATELADLAEHRRDQLSRRKAIDALEKLLDTTDDPVERRRAASAILRPQYRRAPIARPSRLDLEAKLPKPFVYRGPHWPVKDDSPQESVRRVLKRLRANDNPTPNAGLTTLYNYFTKHAKVRRDGDGDPITLDDYLARPDEDGDLINFTAAYFAPLQHPCDLGGVGAAATSPTGRTIKPENLAAQPVRLTFDSGHELHCTFLLQRIPFDDGTQRWAIRDVDHGNNQAAQDPQDKQDDDEDDLDDDLDDRELDDRQETDEPDESPDPEAQLAAHLKAHPELDPEIEAAALKQLEAMRHKDLADLASTRPHPQDPSDPPDPQDKSEDTS